MDPWEASALVGRGVAPSPFGQLLRDRSLRLAAGLAIAVAIPVAVLFYFQFRSIADLGRSSTVVLKQLSQETANGLIKDIQDALKAPYINVLLRITQGRLEPLDLPFIENAIADGFAADPFIDRFYVWSDETREHRGELLAFDRGSRTYRTGVPEGAMIVKRFHELAAEQRAISVFEATIDGRRTYFQAQLRFTFPTREKLTSFEAFRVDAERLSTDYFPSLIEA